MAIRCKAVFVIAVVFGVAAAFFIIGSLGPVSNDVLFHRMSWCVVPYPFDHLRGSKGGGGGKHDSFIDESNCDIFGRNMVDHDTEPQIKLKAYPTKHVVFFAEIPQLSQSEGLSRLYQFLLADLGLHFTSVEYPRDMIEMGSSTLKFEIAIGYRDSYEESWHLLAKGNVSRTLHCEPSSLGSGVHSCEHFPLFELGSCHHKSYLVNMMFPTSFPLGDTMDKYKGLAPIADLIVYALHQTKGFTQLWFSMKLVFCPLCAFFLVWFAKRLTSEPTLTQKALVFLGSCLTFYNIPVELLSLYFDLPWILVLNDFRHGLLITALFSFWIILIGEHRLSADPQSSISHYWKEIGIVSTASVFFFIYEFCQRGIQIFFPFYSLWNTWLSRIVAWFFVGVASVCSFVYLLILLVTATKVYWTLAKKQRAVSDMSESARKRFESLFSRWKLFLVLTLTVAVVSVLSIFLPVGLFHVHKDYALYSGLQFANYSLWNAYLLAMLLLYSPTKGSGVLDRSEGREVGDGGSDEAHTFQKFLAKHSQE